MTEKEQDIIYIFPSDEGTLEEYIKIVSGKVDRRKPSFVKGPIDKNK
ncbi:hypothetical protein JJQ72_14915 [Paenibacillus sp. F411]|nr:hypothetical protein [Paenibacillus sp. F411]MBO2945267.1 hypothetical protein [Paenibacillus sp. F411]